MTMKPDVRVFVWYPPPGGFRIRYEVPGEKDLGLDGWLSSAEQCRDLARRLEEIADQLEGTAPTVGRMRYTVGLSGEQVLAACDPERKWDIPAIKGRKLAKPKAKRRARDSEKEAPDAR